MLLFFFFCLFHQFEQCKWGKIYAEKVDVRICDREGELADAMQNVFYSRGTPGFHTDVPQSPWNEIK